LDAMRERLAAERAGLADQDFSVLVKLLDGK